MVDIVKAERRFIFEHEHTSHDQSTSKTKIKYQASVKEQVLPAYNIYLGSCRFYRLGFARLFRLSFDFLSGGPVKVITL